MSSSEFAGKAVIVTGAAQGIGRTIAEQFIRQGARVLIFDLDAELAMETTRQLSPDGNMAACVGGDVSRREDVHRAVETCIERFGRLDVMVAHAGIADAQPLLEIDDASWQRILDVNLTGVFLCTQEAGRVMARSGGGTIVVTASTNAFWVESNLAHYNTSKGGVVAFVRSAAIDLARYGIRVNAVAPGVVLTRIAAWVTEDPVLAARRWVSWWILPVRLFPARDARTPGRGSIMRLHKISRKTRNLPLAERSEGLRASAHALSMTGRDLSGDKELSRSFEPCLNFIIEKQGGQHAHLISIPVVVWR